MATNADSARIYDDNDSLSRVRVTFDVTQDDIINGVRCNPQGCAVARSFKRTLPHVDLLEVDISYIKWEYNGWLWKWEVPPHLSDLIRDFDDEDAYPDPQEAIDPFQFTIHPDEVKAYSRCWRRNSQNNC